MGELVMGRGSYGSIIRRGTMNNIKIGNYCSIAEGCVCDGGFGHNTKFITTYPFSVFKTECSNLKGHPICKGDIIIGNDVWIGEGCMIMGGVKIGDGAVIGARSIVTKDIQAYAIAAGSPAREVKMRFTHAQIEKLLQIRWWDWDETKIIENSHLLMSENIEDFITKYT